MNIDSATGLTTKLEFVIEYFRQADSFRAANEWLLLCATDGELKNGVTFDHLSDSHS